jgi:signal peptidase II
MLKIASLAREKNMRATWFLTTIIVIGLDQASKYFVNHHLKLWETVKVIPNFFDLTLRYNTGAAYSLLAHESGWQRWFLIGLAIIVSLVIFGWLRRLSAKEKLEGFALSLILGGAIGNLLDRIMYGHVIDFILWYHKHWEFPAFNIADSAITLGVLLLMLSLYKKN